MTINVCEGIMEMKMKEKTFSPIFYQANERAQGTK
jgi:hypothetical protein